MKTGGFEKTPKQCNQTVLTRKSQDLSRLFYNSTVLTKKDSCHSVYEYNIPVSICLDLKHANCIIFVLQLSTFLAWRQLFASHTIIIFNWGTLSCYFAHGRAASFALWPDNPNLVQKIWTIFSIKTSQNLAQILKTLAK